MYRMIVFVVILASICSLSHFGTAVRETRSQETDKVNIELSNYRPPIVRGMLNELKAVGKSTIQAVEITPSDGISIRGIKEGIPDPNNRKEQKREAGTKIWSVSIFVDKAAKAGERSLVLVTSEGRSKPETILVATHVPRISGLKILSAEQSDSRMKIELSVYDVAGDFGAESSINWHLYCGGTGLLASTFFNKNPLKGNLLQTTLAQLGSLSGGICDLVVSVEDKNGYTSNTIKTKVAFK
ncbi:MAG: hypothetical protein ACREAB_16225 [Blastocatellia bacterium]